MSESITQESGYWDGAIGFFTSKSNPVLRGLFFYVQKWTAGLDEMPRTLQLTQTLPAMPVSTDKFRLLKGQIIKQTPNPRESEPPIDFRIYLI